MDKTKESVNEISKSLAGFLSYALPLIQFFYLLFPGTTAGIFLNREVFLAASVLTLLVSFLVIFWYRQRPFISIQPFWWQNKKYRDYLDRINPQRHTPEEIKKVKRVGPPFRIDHHRLVLIFIVAILFLGLIFIWLGMSLSMNPPLFYTYLQAIIYILVIILTVLTATIIYEEQVRLQEWRDRRKRRVSKAIGLAIENNALPNIPVINFIKTEGEEAWKLSFSTIVEIQNARYKITTDNNAEILYEVEQLGPMIQEKIS